MWSNLVAVCGIILLCGVVGLVMYSKYFDCDPLTAKVSKPEKVVLKHIHSKFRLQRTKRRHM